MADYWHLPWTGQEIQDALANAAPRIGTNNTWETWDISTGTWYDTGVNAEAKNPYIGANTHWYVWDDELGSYVDSGLIAGYVAYTGSVEEVT